MFAHSAHVYDLIYASIGKDYANEAAEVAALILERTPHAMSVLDVACGTGGHLRHLAGSFEVAGVDLDPEMLKVARTHLPDVALVEGDMRTVQLGRTFDAVICLFSSVGYVRDVGELTMAVCAMAAHLAPGGVLIVDGWVRPEAWRDEHPPVVETARDDELTVVRMSTSLRRGATTRLEMHHLVATSEGIEHLVDHHYLTLFADAEYQSAFQAAGLVVQVLESPMADRDRYVGMKAS